MISLEIDVSKNKSTACALEPYGEVVLSPFEVAHDKHAVSKLVSEPHAMDDELRIVMGRQEQTTCLCCRNCGQQDFLSVWSTHWP